MGKDMFSVQKIQFTYFIVFPHRVSCLLRDLHFTQDKILDSGLDDFSQGSFLGSFTIQRECFSITHRINEMYIEKIKTSHEELQISTLFF